MIPIEWLNELIETRDGFRNLLNQEGLTRAAYRLALAKCMNGERSTHVPTRGEVRAAAREIAARVPGTSVPDTSTLVRDLEALGIAVL